MTNIKRTNNWKMVFGALVILLAGICTSAGFVSTGVTSAQSISVSSPNRQDVVRNTNDQAGKQESQVRESNLLKDAVTQTAEKETVKKESGLNESRTMLLADGSSSDEPLLQKFIKKLGSIIWG